jgi:heme/copper-type cytochrome/quinol oxidase subunit 3
MIRAREVRDVSELPQNIFGAGALTWWGMMGMMVAEGVTLALVVTAYLYIQQKSATWPPAHTPLPELGVAIAALIVLLMSVFAAWWAAKRGRARDARGAFIGLCVQSALCILALILRWFEFKSVGVRWDTNAYGSVVWAVLTAHTLVALLDVLDTLGLTLLFGISEPEVKHFVDLGENSVFWYFVVASWIPLFVLVFLQPHWL